jgi:hypothetical protein
VARTRAEARREDFGPTLGELLAPRLRSLRPWQRAVLAVALLALVAAVIALVIRGETGIESYRQDAGDASARGLAPISFNFDYSAKMTKTHPKAAYVAVERDVGGTLSGRFTVSELRLGRQRGLVSGFMPILATRYERRAAQIYPGFRLAFEGRARVNEVEGYQFAFTARLERPGKPARQLFGRTVMLPEPYDLTDPELPYPAGEGPTRGLVITMLATTLDKVPSATRVGDEGILQRPFRSFRYGAG